MYRRILFGQQKLELPFGVELDAENRWVKLSRIMPWDKIEEIYVSNFKGTTGQVAKSSRLAFGALYIQNRLVLTDEETVEQIRETPAMQYFCGFDSYTTEKPFDSSLLVHFRKRITKEMMKEISEEAFAAEAKKAIEEEDDDKDGNGGGNGESKPNKGRLLLDSTCCPSDISYPTDINLLNNARELTEEIIDNLHEQNMCQGFEKPQTHDKAARRDYINFIKKRKHNNDEVRLAIQQQLQYVRQNLDSITKQEEQGANLDSLGRVLKEKLLVISEVYRQQKQMYDENSHSIEDRIVSISQPYIRPIVRGKANAPVEFGAKVATAHIGGFSFLIHMGYDNFAEANYLEKSAEEYKRMFGFYPEVIIGDKAYPTNLNRDYCKKMGIRLSALSRGRKSEEFKEAEREQLYQDNCKRNAVEGDYGNGKRKYGLGLIMEKLIDTTLTTISFGFFVKNMERLLKISRSTKPSTT